MSPGPVEPGEEKSRGQAVREQQRQCAYSQENTVLALADNEDVLVEQVGQLAHHPQKRAERLQSGHRGA